MSRLGRIRGTATSGIVRDGLAPTLTYTFIIAASFFQSDTTSFVPGGRTGCVFGAIGVKIEESRMMDTATKKQRSLLCNELCADHDPPQAPNVDFERAVFPQNRGAGQ
jgi:hypothetical protein